MKFGDNIVIMHVKVNLIWRPYNYTVFGVNVTWRQHKYTVLGGK